MKNNGPVYNLTTGKINFPIDERVAIDPEGHIVGSWAIWTPPGDTPKSNTHDMAWLNKENLLDTLDTGFVFVGLNWSSTHGDQTKGGELAWSNFHGSYAYQHELQTAIRCNRYPVLGFIYDRSHQILL